MKKITIDFNVYEWKDLNKNQKEDVYYAAFNNKTIFESCTPNKEYKNNFIELKEFNKAKPKILKYLKKCYFVLISSINDGVLFYKKDDYDIESICEDVKRFL